MYSRNSHKRVFIKLAKGIRWNAIKLIQEHNNSKLFFVLMDEEIEGVFFKFVVDKKLDA